MTAPKLWLAYGPDSRRPGVSPASYGASPARMSFAQWRRFTGICGHQHVPENAHGDPGNLPIDKILRYAGATTTEEDDMTPKEKRELAAQIAEFVLDTHLKNDDGKDIGTVRSVLARINRRAYWTTRFLKRK